MHFIIVLTSLITTHEAQSPIGGGSELFRQGLEDVEYLAMLDRVAGAADAAHGCGYEAAVLGGPGAVLAPPPVSACCVSLGEAKGALDAVDDVTWGITASSTGLQAGNPPYNMSEAEPYTTDPCAGRCGHRDREGAEPLCLRPGEQACRGAGRCELMCVVMEENFIPS
jgi:hypothetical protein